LCISGESHNGAISSKHLLSLTKLSSSEYEDAPSHSKLAKRPARKPRRLVSEASEGEEERQTTSSRRSTRAHRPDDTMEDEDELYGEEGEDDKDGDYSVPSQRAAGGRRGRPKKNLDDKENEDDLVDNSSFTEK
jgi:hypothetical protein